MYILHFMAPIATTNLKIITKIVSINDGINKQNKITYLLSVIIAGTFGAGPDSGDFAESLFRLKSQRYISLRSFATEFFLVKRLTITIGVSKFVIKKYK